MTAVPVYRWVPPDDEGPARRLVREAIDGQLTAVTFTCPSAVASTCRIADADHVLDELLAAFESRVTVACVGPTTAAAARDRGIRVRARSERRTARPARAVAGGLAAEPARAPARGGQEVLLQGNLVLAPNTSVALPDRERQVLAALARRPGLVVSRAAIERDVWQSTDEDRALEAVLSRLRKHLAPTGLEIETRVRRGYQLLAAAAPCPVEASGPGGRPASIAS